MTEPDPAPTTAQMLEAVEAFIRRFVIFQSEAQSIAVSLWVLHTHAVDAAEQSPYLAITSPEMQSAKSRLLEVLELIVPRPWRIEKPSEAVVFRKIDSDTPTLLLDETDAIFGKGKDADQHEGLRALLNAGNRRGSTVPRCVGAKMALKNFKVFCPKALAGIGNLPGTIESRSIPIRMARKHKSESVERFRFKRVSPQGLALHTQLVRWSLGVSDLEDAEPELPEELSDRQQDSWEPLLAIADDAGADWPGGARAAAIELHAQKDEDSAGTLLLAHIREAFEDAIGTPSENVISTEGCSRFS